MDKKLLADFKSPPSQYRGKPFWAWNGKLDPAELRRQIRVMQQMGLGGFFMHSRVGLSTPYLGSEWFTAINACIDEAQKLDMEAWLYDEDRWPSGAAGGLVTKNPKHRMRHLKLEILPNPTPLKWTPDILAVFSADIDGTNASNLIRLTRTTAKKAQGTAVGSSLLIFRAQQDKLSPWYNGYTYLDTLSAPAVAQFIKTTHEAYRKRIGKHFGARVPGIFTDEPNYGMHDADTRAWTDSLPSVFRKRYGYDLIDRLPELFFNIDGREISSARYHYYDCITYLFVNAFSKQIGQWCDKNSLLYTGHMLFEDTLRDQTRAVGAAMRHYEYMQAAGMDLLTEHWRCYITAKQVSSAARQFGWKWRLTETYGCTGWDFPFEAHKALGDWQAACGINLRCPHLCWYTMQGEAKRDYPASIFYQSPWYQHYRKVEDYYARITAVMTRGSEVRDLLVIHPIESMWAIVPRDFNKNQALADYDQLFNDLTNALLCEQLDFDYGDEEILSRHAKVSTTNGRGVFKVNKATYKAILVPPLKTIRSSTLALLKKFKSAGGTVVFAGEIAQYVDAEPSAALADFAATCLNVPVDAKALSDALSPAARRIRITDSTNQSPGTVIYLLREDKNNFYLFLANTSHTPRVWAQDPLTRDRTQSFDQIQIQCFPEAQGSPIELDPESAELFTASATRDGNGWTIQTSLPRLASRLYIIPKQEADIQYPPRPTLADIRTDSLGGPFDITLSEPNNLVLDRPRYKTGNNDWQPPTEILRVDRAVRESLGIPPRGGAMVQPWARKQTDTTKHASLTLSYTFNIQSLPSGGLSLAIEEPLRYHITLNNQTVNTDADSGWWTDKSLRTLPLDPAILKLGPNELTLTTNFDETSSGLEIIYLLGNFGSVVNNAQLTLTAPPTSLQLGDWVPQGLAFYSGSVAYRKKITPNLQPNQRLFIRLPDYRAVAVRILVDGKPAGIIAWPPNELDITPFLTSTSHDLAIEILGHRRNSHGPLHHKDLWPQWTGPDQFTTKGDQWTDHYQLVPCGLMQPPQLIVRQ